jgi:hypothetical protein
MEEEEEEEEVHRDVTVSSGVGSRRRPATTEEQGERDFFDA